MPHTVISIIPASDTLRIKMVLCDKHGRALYCRHRRVESDLGFETIGSGYGYAFEDWRKQAEEQPENHFPADFSNLQYE